MLSIDFLEKVLGLISPPYFDYDWFFKKNISHVILPYYTKWISSGTLININLGHSKLIYPALINVACNFL